MNLFVDAHIFDNSLEGSRTYLKGLYSELIRMNPSVSFYIGAFDIQNIKKEFGESANVRYVKYFTKNKFIRLAVNIPFLILRNKIDISHFQYFTPLFRFSKEIVTIHDILFLDFPDLFPTGYRIRNKYLFLRSSKRADYILTVSEYSRKSISKHLNVNENDIYVVSNGVSEEYFERKRPMPDLKVKYNLDKFILYVSRIEPRKNHIMLLRAFVELNLWREGYKLVFIGGRAIKTPELDDYMNELPEEISESIIFIEESKDDELRSFYRSCRIFVYPSFAEGFGIPPLEAIASGVPVLCSNSTAMSDFTFFNERFFDPASLSELKEKILSILNTSGSISDEDIEYVRVNYNWNNSAVKFTEIILNQKPQKKVL